MNKINYQKELEKIIENNLNKNIRPSLMLHACCAPCSSYVLEYLSQYFDITVVFYNPNIYGEDEYNHRAEELKRFVQEKPFDYPVKVEIIEFHPDDFYQAVKGMENEKEGGSRCFVCYELRMRYAAMLASDKYDYFATTLTISPLKKAQIINEIGLKIEKDFNTKYLVSDFKKKNGYKRSIELSGEYNLYRQNFCGCEYSKR